MYTGQITYKWYDIEFDYKYNGDELKLITWRAYEENCPVSIPCVLVSQAIESKIRIHLTELLDWDYTNFKEDLLAHDGDEWLDGFRGK